MLGIAIELGTYSVKIVKYKSDKKKLSIISSDEIIIDYETIQPGDDHVLWSHQLMIVKDFLNTVSEDDYQLLMNIPSKIVTTRFLNIPVANKKKATAMLPFQIEDDLPFSLSEAVYAESIETSKDSSRAITGIVQTSTFEDFHGLLKHYDIKPNILTQEVCSLANIIKDNAQEFPLNFCVLNFGHQVTEGHYFRNGQIISNHRSYIAGEAITEVISQTYPISGEEATIYKHQKAFVLTGDQHEQVNSNQKEFAMLMDRTLSPLLNDIKRWNIGYRVKFGETIEKIYITGGSANLKHFQYYLESQTGIKVEVFDPYQFCNDIDIDNDIKFRQKMAMTTTLALNSLKKNRLSNFLKNHYVLQDNENLPLEMVGFLGIRALLIAIVISGYFLFQGIYTTSQIQKVDKAMASTLKNDILGLSGRDIRTSRKRPQNILSKLSRVEKSINQEVKLIQSSVNVGTLFYLNKLAAHISTPDVEVIELKMLSGTDFEITLFSEDISKIKELDAQLAIQFQDYSIDLDESKKQLKIAGDINE